MHKADTIIKCGLKKFKVLICSKLIMNGFYFYNYSHSIERLLHIPIFN